MTDDSFIPDAAPKQAASTDSFVADSFVPDSGNTQTGKKKKRTPADEALAASGIVAPVSPGGEPPTKVPDYDVILPRPFVTPKKDNLFAPPEPPAPSRNTLGGVTNELGLWDKYVQGPVEKAFIDPAIEGAKRMGQGFQNMRAAAHKYAPTPEDPKSPNPNSAKPDESPVLAGLHDVIEGGKQTAGSLFGPAIALSPRAWVPAGAALLADAAAKPVAQFQAEQFGASPRGAEAVGDMAGLFAGGMAGGNVTGQGVKDTLSRIGQFLYNARRNGFAPKHDRIMAKFDVDQNPVQAAQTVGNFLAESPTPIKTAEQAHDVGWKVTDKLYKQELEPELNTSVNRGDVVPGGDILANLQQPSRVGRYRQKRQPAAHAEWLKPLEDYYGNKNWNAQELFEDIGDINAVINDKLSGAPGDVAAKIRAGGSVAELNFEKQILQKFLKNMVEGGNPQPGGFSDKLSAFGCAADLRDAMGRARVPAKAEHATTDMGESIEKLTRPAQVLVAQLPSGPNKAVQMANLLTRSPKHIDALVEHLFSRPAQGNVFAPPPTLPPGSPTPFTGLPGVPQQNP